MTQRGARLLVGGQEPSQRAPDLAGDGTGDQSQNQKKQCLGRPNVEPRKGKRLARQVEGRDLGYQIPSPLPGEMR